MTVKYNTRWKEDFAPYIQTPEQAAKNVKPGQRVFVGTGCAEPLRMVQALADRAPQLSDVEVLHLLTFGDAPYARKELAGSFRVNCFYVTDNVRSVVQEGVGNYTPIFLKDIPALFSSGRMPIDVALIQVTPPDERGRCSLGMSVDIVKNASQNAAFVIAQVNPKMPWTHGDSQIHIHDIDVLVPVDDPIQEFQPKEHNEVTRRIGKNLASLIERGSTLELGIGQIPHGVLEFLGEKKDLGIHTEMISDPIVDLVEKGVINGSKKVKDRGKIVASFAVGTKRLFDYIDDNPVFSFRTTDYVNDPAIIRQMSKMVAINVALEVDLTGQVCSDSLGSSFYSGIGGQVDFTRGAANSKYGKAIIALPSTTSDGKSRIVSRLSPGAGVVTTRGDVHYVVTEYGVAYLHGKTIQDRAMALISIAHPDHRSQILKEALEAKYIRASIARIGDRLVVEPQDIRTSMILDDGTHLAFRPIHPTDEPAMKDLFYKLSEATLYYRFGMKMKKVPARQMEDFTFIDHRKEVAIVGTLPAPQGEEIVAICRYYLDATTNRAEVALVTRDDWQNRGVGSFMMKFLTTIAKRNGIRGFTAEILVDNKPMQAVLHKVGGKLRSSFSDGVISYIVDFQ